MTYPDFGETTRQPDHQHPRHMPGSVTSDALASNIQLPNGIIVPADFASSVYGPAPAIVQVGGAGSAGAATTVSRSDHTHTLSSGTPVDVGTANAPGTAAFASRSDHVHSLGLHQHIGKSCRLKRSTTQTITTGTITPINWDAEIRDVYNMHDPANPTRLVGPWAGFYACHASVSWAANTGGFFRKCFITTNGGAQWEAQSIFGPLGASTQPINHVAATGILLAVNEYIEIEVDQDAGANRDVGGDFAGLVLTMVNFTYQGPG